MSLTSGGKKMRSTLLRKRTNFVSRISEEQKEVILGKSAEMEQLKARNSAF